MTSSSGYYNAFVESGYECTEKKIDLAPPIGYKAANKNTQQPFCSAQQQR